MSGVTESSREGEERTLEAKKNRSPVPVGPPSTACHPISIPVPPSLIIPSLEPQAHPTCHPCPAFVLFPAEKMKCLALFMGVINRTSSQPCRAHTTYCEGRGSQLPPLSGPTLWDLVPGSPSICLFFQVPASISFLSSSSSPQPPSFSLQTLVLGKESSYIASLVSSL